MLPDVTPAVERALEAAQSWARRLGASDVQPVHLLCGLLEEEEGRAAALVRNAGLDPVAARHALTPPTPNGPSHPEDVTLPLNPASHGSFRAARRLAEELCESGVASGTLLLALLRREDCAREVLETLGLVLARIEEAVLPAPQPPLAMDEPLNLGPMTHSPPSQVPITAQTEVNGNLATARILDASANRGREALRVVEDYCRFVLDDSLLTRELKQLRHTLAAALETLPPEWLLSARDTQRDVGTTVTTSREETRQSPQHVAFVNLKRLQEALRSLEEYGKIVHPHLGHTIEQLRYQCYTLERAIVLRVSSPSSLARARLCVLVTEAQCKTGLESVVRGALTGGAQVIQLREKGITDREWLARARKVRRWTREAGALFVVNDRVDLARLAEADGVHLGQDDLSVAEARSLLGPERIIGVSTHNPEQLRQAVLDGASYVGVGPTFSSGTKDFATLAGLDYVRHATATTTLPAFVIGGVNIETVPHAVRAGARRIAVSGAVCGADNPVAATAELLRGVEDVK